MRAGRLERVLLVLAAPALALVFSAAVATAVLLVAGFSPGDVIPPVVAFGSSASSAAAVVDKAATYYLAGLSAAIGFRMLLFNIGIDGQYRLGVFAAAVVGAAVTLPPVLHIALIVIVAMMTGALWAAIAGYLKVRRGVSEVISTIMLNVIATGLIAYLLTPGRLAERAEGSNNISTPMLPESAWLPDIPLGDQSVFGFVPFAVLMGVAYWWLLGRTRFGFDLRASGLSLRAAAVSGVDSRRMVLITIMMSGAVAGVAGLPQLLGSSHRYGLDFPPGYGFTGLAIALLGRNSPVGVAFGALLWAWLERSAQMFDLLGVSKEIVTILQAVIVLSVVVAYEFVRRASIARQQRQVRRLDAASAAGGDA